MFRFPVSRLKAVICILLSVSVFLFPFSAQAFSWPSARQNMYNHNAASRQPEMPFTRLATVMNQYVNPVVEGDMMITAVTEGTKQKIIAYQGSTATKKWEFSLGDLYPKQPIIDRGVVYFGTHIKPNVYALNLLTGSLLWQQTLPGESTGIRHWPIVIGEYVFVAASRLHRLSRTGQHQWSQLYNLDQPLASDGSFLYLRAHDLKMHKIDINSGVKIWSAATDSTAGSEPVIANGIIYVGTYYKILAFSNETGVKLWEYNIPSGGPLVGSVAAAGDLFFFGAIDRSISALDTHGSLVWRTSFKVDGQVASEWQPSFLIAGDRLLIQSAKEEQAVVEAQTGVVLYKGLAIRASDRFQAIANDIIITGDGQTSALWAADSWNNGTLREPLNEKRIDPVIVIPGILESWPVNGQWRIDPVFHVFDDLLNTFRLVGYIDDQTLFTFPYDWHLSNVETANQLRQKITEIKQQTGALKVDIVAHSMGGLAARAYVVGDLYNDDVDELIAIATPQYGSVKSYLTWEAGETGTSAVDILKEQFIGYEAQKSGYGFNKMAYVQEKITSVGELLPTFDYLRKYDVPLKYGPCDSFLHPCNAFLEALHLKNDRYLYRVQAHHYIGALGGNSTMRLLRIGDPLVDGRFPHGAPLNYPDPSGWETGEGDGTVLLSSAHLSGVDETILKADHTGIVGAVATDIVWRLSGKKILASPQALPSRFLFLRLFSPVNMLLQDGQGRRIGLLTENGQLVNEIPGAYYSGPPGSAGGSVGGNAPGSVGGSSSLQSNLEYIILPQPEDISSYRLTLQGTGEGTYKVSGSYIENDSLRVDEGSGSVAPGTVVEYDVVLSGQEVQLVPLPVADPCLS